jgi:hypothetical protein
VAAERDDDDAGDDDAQPRMLAHGRNSGAVIVLLSRNSFR